MARAKGGQTLELSAQDNAELLALCIDHGDAEKKWLGAVFLRYGMNHSEKAMAEDGAASLKRTRKRRQEQSKGDQELLPSPKT
jgi:hypothetical protein